MTARRSIRLLLSAALLGACTVTALPGAVGAAAPIVGRVRNVDTGVT